MAPTVSSTGIFGSTRCAIKEIDGVILSRLRLFSHGFFQMAGGVDGQLAVAGTTRTCGYKIFSRWVSGPGKPSFHFLHLQDTAGLSQKLSNSDRICSGARESIPGHPGFRKLWSCPYTPKHCFAAAIFYPGPIFL